MTKPSALPAVFACLRDMLKKFEPAMVCQQESENDYSLDSGVIMGNQKPMFFASVSLKKNQVSFYLMPVYVFPELLMGLSSELNKCLKGKSCFHFKRMDHVLFDELLELTEAGFRRFQEAGYLRHKEGGA